MNVCSFRADMPGAPQEISSRMPIFGDTLRSTIVVRGALHSTPPFLRLERVIRSRLGSFRVVRGTRSTTRVTCDLSSVGNQEGKNQMTKDTVKC